MSTHLNGFQSFFRFLHHFVLAKVATSSIRVKEILSLTYQYCSTKYLSNDFYFNENITKIVHP